MSFTLRSVELADGSTTNAVLEDLIRNQVLGADLQARNKRCLFDAEQIKPTVDWVVIRSGQNGR